MGIGSSKSVLTLRDGSWTVKRTPAGSWLFHRAERGSPWGDPSSVSKKG
jgi:hypothetical protein